MEFAIEKTFFSIIDPPNLKINIPKWLRMPSPMEMLIIAINVYFLMTAGIIYDIINEPPSLGSEMDERGNSRPVAILKYRINGQYIMEGIVAGFMFSLGGLGFVILDKCNNPQTSKTNRFMLFGLGFANIIISYFVIQMFIKIKMPNF